MINKFKKIFNRTAVRYWLLALIFLVGIFLRTYHYHDWLRFNADQGRDAILVGDVVTGKTTWPLLGPKAGGTEFKLGPAFYYFEIISAKLFGNYPDKMAYPDLLTSLLCIPLLFLFLRKYFDIKLATALTALFSLSFYAIQYSRFAWNPNSIPFWVILTLYGIINIIEKKNNNKIIWSIVSGIAIGIGMQLHTTLFAFLPIVTIVVFFTLAIKNKRILKYFFIILAISLLLNIPQFIDEYQTHGKNMQAFFGGIKTKQKKENSILADLIHDTSCWTQGNIEIISGYEISDSCSIKTNGNITDIIILAIGLLFVFGGTLIGFSYFLKEIDFNKKAFLGVVFLYLSIAYIVFIPIAFELSMRFFLVIIFSPFLLAGFWVKFLIEKFSQKRVVIALIILFLFLAGSNLYFTQKTFATNNDYEKGKAKGKIDIVNLGEIEAISDFIIANSDKNSQIYLGGNQQALFKATKSIEFLVAKAQIKVIPIHKNDNGQRPFFTLTLARKKGKLSNLSANEKEAILGRFLINLKK
jgi:4-amino-4-deoxy-L-arabinose transferase-like glycosyltransferase